MKTKHPSAGFTLVEVMVSAGIIVIIMGVLLGMTDQTQRLVKATSSKVEQFQEARVAFESMTRNISQATLNAFLDYVYNNTNAPVGYQRTAELRFHSGPMNTLSPNGGPNGNIQPGHGIFFQAPIGRVNDTVNLGALDHLMNTYGYFLEIGTDADKLPTFLQTYVSPRKRYRLYEFMEPSEQLSVYNVPNQADALNINWFSKSLSYQSTTGATSTMTNVRPARVLAENIVALIILPRLSAADEVRYNTAKGITPTNTPVYFDPTTYEYSSTLHPTLIDSNPQVNTVLQLRQPFNQLPPMVQVIMVAIDEPSARRLEDLYSTDNYLGIGTNPDPLSQRTLFAAPTSLNDTAAGAPGDLTRLQSMLTYRKVSYRVFSTNVTIKGAKWSLH